MPDERSDVFDVFSDEALENIHQIHRRLLALRYQAADDALLAEATQAADVLIGSALTVDLDEIGKSAGTIRDLLISAREGRLSLDETRFVILFHSLEEIAGGLDQVIGEKRRGIAQVAVLGVRECVDQLCRQLLRLGDDPPDSAVASAARTLAATLIEKCDRYALAEAGRIARRIEAVLCAAGEGTFEIDGHVRGLLLQGVGFLEILLDAAAKGMESGLDIDELCEILYGALPVVTSAGYDSAVAPASRLLAAGLQESGATRPGERAAKEHEMVKRGIVLIASDSNLFNQALIDVLSRKGLEVNRVTDARELVSHIEKRDVDLCFLRDSLPNGLAACEQLSKSPQEGRSIPIVVYSPLTRMQKIALEKGATAFLKVPCEPIKVLALVDRWTGDKTRQL